MRELIYVGRHLVGFDVYADDTNSDLYDQAYTAVLSALRDDADFRAEMLSYDYLPTPSRERFTVEMNKYTRDVVDAFERDDPAAIGRLLSRNIETYIAEVYDQLLEARDAE